MDTPDAWEVGATASRWPTPFATDDLDWQAHVRKTALATDATELARDMIAALHTGQEHTVNSTHLLTHRTPAGVTLLTRAINARTESAINAAIKSDMDTIRHEEGPDVIVITTVTDMEPS